LSTDPFHGSNILVYNKIIEIIICFIVDHFWAAPEHLRTNCKTISQQGDIYSFGIILYEILTRNEPFGEELDMFTSEGTLCYI